MEEGVLRLKWRDHRTTLSRTLTSHRTKGRYCDATLTCEGRFYPVHKIVLGGCSDFFQRMFESGEMSERVVVVLADLCHHDLEALLDYMYVGEANILQGDLSRFMKAAEALKIRGLAEPVNASPERETEDGKREDREREETTRTERQETGEGKRTLGATEITQEPKRRRDANPERTRTRSSQNDPENQSRATHNEVEMRVRTNHGENEAWRRSNRGQGKEQQGTTGVDTELLSPALLATVEMDSQPEANRGHAITTTIPLQDDNTTLTHQSEVKMEDINIKEEVEDWGGGVGEGGGDREPRIFSDTGLSYLTTNPTTTTTTPTTPSTPATPALHTPPQLVAGEASTSALSRLQDSLSHSPALMRESYEFDVTINDEPLNYDVPSVSHTSQPPSRPPDESQLRWQIVEGGTARGRKQLYNSQGYIYTMKRTTPWGAYWWCSVRQRQYRCPATVIQKDNKFSLGSHPHNHTAPVPGRTKKDRAPQMLQDPPLFQAHRQDHNCPHDNCPPHCCPHRTPGPLTIIPIQKMLQGQFHLDSFLPG